MGVWRGAYSAAVLPLLSRLVLPARGLSEQDYAADAGGCMTTEILCYRLPRSMTAENVVMTQFSHYNFFPFRREGPVSHSLLPHQTPSVPPDHLDSQRRDCPPTARKSLRSRVNRRMASNEDEMAEFQARSDVWQPDVQVSSSATMSKYHG